MLRSRAAEDFRWAFDRIVALLDKNVPSHLLHIGDNVNINSTNVINTDDPDELNRGITESLQRIEDLRRIASPKSNEG